MKQYIYDGTFEGLLTAVFYAYTEKGPREIVKAGAEERRVGEEGTSWCRSLG